MTNASETCCDAQHTDLLHANSYKNKVQHTIDYKRFNYNSIIYMFIRSKKPPHDTKLSIKRE